MRLYVIVKCSVRINDFQSSFCASILALFVFLLAVAKHEKRKQIFNWVYLPHDYK